MRHLTEVGHRPAIDVQAVYRDNLMQIVASGRGLMFIREAAVANHFPRIVCRRLVGEMLLFYAIWSRDNDNPSLNQLLSLAQDFGATIVG
jgi:hypothetical protein